MYMYIDHQHDNWDMLCGYGVEFEYSGWESIFFMIHVPSDVFFEGRWEVIVIVCLFLKQ